MNVLDLFSGIGGFALGLERAGFRTTAFCEIEPHCRAVLRKHWPETPIYDDVRTLTASALSRDGIEVDVICGGFPCQPWSLAGQRKGRDDDRDLWPEMLRIIGDCQPRWVIGENVPGLDDKRFMALDGVLSDLENAGYEARPFEIPACAVDAPHKRSRLFIVANAKHGGRGGQQAGAGGDIADGRQAGRQQDACGAGDSGAGALADSQRAGLEELRSVTGNNGSEQPTAQRNGALVNGQGERWGEGRAGTEVRSRRDAASGAGGARNGAVGHANSLHTSAERKQRGGQLLRASGDQESYFGECEWLVDPQGKARRVKPGIRLLANGVPARTQQIRGYGNSVVPQIITEIGRAIMVAEGLA